MKLTTRLILRPKRKIKRPCTWSELSHNAHKWRKMTLREKERHHVTSTLVYVGRAVRLYAKVKKMTGISTPEYVEGADRLMR